MPATMFAVVRTFGYGKPQYVSLPFVAALLNEPESPQRYFVLPPEDEPAPPPAPKPDTAKHGPRPRYRDLGEPLE